MAQTNLTIRIDEDIKREAEALFNKIGLNMSSAINVFFRQAIREQAIPFELRAYDAFYSSPEALEALEEAKQLINDPNAKRYSNIEGLFADCLEGDDDDE
ncbi:MAG: type II toxin-antitoxin system RelB/DinJ family antitoxin [Defluviitaleaceae bacterium]|nr:type II toxin-antitoxin system RelB/DinJ family antitoxin [Defluviitaleaceae bacterium]